MSSALCQNLKLAGVYSILVSELEQEISRISMDRLYTQELRRLHRELESTLTPKQRQLLAVGALSPEMCTPEQIEILIRMDPYLEGLTPEQARLLGGMDTFAEGWEAGQEKGKNLER